MKCTLSVKNTPHKVHCYIVKKSGYKKEKNIICIQMLDRSVGMSDMKGQLSKDDSVVRSQRDAVGFYFYSIDTHKYKNKNSKK